MRRVVFVLSVGLMSLLASQSAQAGIIANYGFTGSSFASADTDVNSTAGDMTVGSGLNYSFNTTSGNLVLNKNSIGNNAAGAISGNDYLQFVLTPAASYHLNLSGNTILLQAVTSGAGEGHWFLRSSLDGYASDITGLSGTSTTTFTDATGTIPSSGFDNLPTITFRLYVYEDKNQDVTFDNIRVNGLAVVPEPVTAALGIFAGLFGVVIVVRSQPVRNRIQRCRVAVVQWVDAA
jgi:hypothetical protein